jgi:hypothetical protein
MREQQPLPATLGTLTVIPNGRYPEAFINGDDLSAWMQAWGGGVREIVIRVRADRAVSCEIHTDVRHNHLVIASEARYEGLAPQVQLTFATQGFCRADEYQPMPEAFALVQGYRTADLYDGHVNLDAVQAVALVQALEERYMVEAEVWYRGRWCLAWTTVTYEDRLELVVVDPVSGRHTMLAPSAVIGVEAGRYGVTPDRVLASLRLPAPVEAPTPDEATSGNPQVQIERMAVRWSSDPTYQQVLREFVQYVLNERGDHGFGNVESVYIAPAAAFYGTIAAPMMGWLNADVGTVLLMTTPDGFAHNGELVAHDAIIIALRTPSTDYPAHTFNLKAALEELRTAR